MSESGIDAEEPAREGAASGRSWIPETTGTVGARSASLGRRLLALRSRVAGRGPHDELRLQAHPVAESLTRGRRMGAGIAARLGERRARRRAQPTLVAATPVEVRGPNDGVLVVRLAGGGRRNVLGRSTVDALEAVFSSPPPGTRAVLLIADPPDFCAGYDLMEAGSGDPETLIASPGNFDALRRCTVPVVAALEGNVIGGGLELALLADVRIAAIGTRLAIPASQLGLVYSVAGVSLLVSLLGESAARAMLLAGRVMEAEAALAAGVVVELVAPDHLEEAALALAGTIASWSGAATSGNRQVLDVVVGRSDVDAAALRLASFGSDGQLADSIRRFAARHGTGSRDGRGGRSELARLGEREVGPAPK